MAVARYYCESHLSPEMHAHEFVRTLPKWKGMVFVYGLGGGYILREMRKKMPEAFFCVLEPNSDHAASFGPEVMKEDPNVRVVDSFKKMRQSYAEFSHRHRGVNFVPLPGYREAHPEHYHSYIEDLHREIATISGDQITALRFSREWQRNTVLNLAHVLESAPAKRLSKMWEGKPGVLLSAGPTLRRDLDLINRLHDRAYFLSCGTNVPLIGKGELRADSVMAFDGGVDNYRAHFRGVQCDLPLIYDTIIHHQVLENWSGPKVLMSVWPTDYTFDKWLGEAPGFISIGPTVASAMLDLLVKMGCNPIIFCGQDLSFVEGLTHATGTSTDPNRNYNESSVGSKRTFAPGVGGGQVPCDWSSIIFAHSLSGYIESHPEIRFINTSMVGAKLRGTEDIPLERVADDILTRDLSREKQTLDAWVRAPVFWSKQKLARSVRNSIHACYRLIHVIRENEANLEQELRRVSHSMFWFVLQSSWFGYHSGRSAEYVRKEAWEAVTFTLPLLQRTLSKLEGRGG